MSPLAWLCLGAAGVFFLLGMVAARTALTPRQVAYRDYLLPHLQTGQDLYRCDRCGFLVGSSSHVDPYTGKDCAGGS